MSSRSGYGRGYYGEGQLAQEPRRKRSWFTIVAVVGVGAAVVWFMWPRKTVYDFSPITKEPATPMLPTGVNTSAPFALAPIAPAQLAPSPMQLTLAPLAAPAQLAPGPPTGAFLKQLEDDARARHFLTVKDYEDSVIRSANQLKTAGATVVLAPHLQHLTPRLEP